MQPDRATLELLFEGAPQFVERLLDEGCASWDELFERAEDVALNMSGQDQLELLNAHPRIGAAPASVSALSYREQGYDRDSSDSDLQNRLNSLNDDYETRHGFRFVIFVDGRSRESIAQLMAGHIDRATDEERERGLRDVVAIARSRHSRMREEQRA
jgi:2-oxo-4-hydroxy-4-carboxy--5-ureidoimidazoline (OHCU) decarboxylase